MADVSRSVGRYLCAIHLLSTESGEPARTNALAERLQVSAASVTEMLATLQKHGLATYEKYHGVELTSEGESIARGLLWKRCVAENFLVDDLGATDPDDADEFGHALSDDVAARLREFIEHPCEGSCSAPNADYDECRETYVVER